MGTNFGDFLARFRDYVEVQQGEIPELFGKDLRRKAKGLSSMRSVAMCGWRSQEIKALPEDIFDLFAIFFKRNREKPAMPRDFASEQWKKINVWELSLWTGPRSSTAMKETLVQMCMGQGSRC